jgi:Fe-S cluster assembly iron-binding protein IscA
MLTLTDSAASAIRSLTATPEVPGQAGLRIMSQGGEDPQLQLALAESPTAGDQVIETQGARVFLEPGAAAILDNKALDAQVSDQGSVSFTVSQQPEV